MRPDTEPNIHAQRIMVGAVLFTAVVALGSIAEWSANNYPTIFAGVLIVSVAAFMCYLVGWSVMSAFK